MTSSKLSKEERAEFIYMLGLPEDVTFFVGDKKEVIKGHSVVLMADSPIFAKILANKSTSRINLPDLTPDAVRILLNYIYTGKSVTSNPDDSHVEILVVYRASKRFQVKGLTQDCIQELRNRMNMSNFAEIIKEAQNQGDEELLGAVQDFMLTTLNYAIGVHHQNQAKAAKSAQGQVTGQIHL